MDLRSKIKKKPQKCNIHLQIGEDVFVSPNLLTYLASLRTLVNMYKK